MSTTHVFLSPVEKTYRVSRLQILRWSVESTRAEDQTTLFHAQADVLVVAGVSGSQREMTQVRRGATLPVVSFNFCGKSFTMNLVKPAFWKPP